MSDQILDIKRTSWVELYFDLVFVLAIAQVSHLIAEEPGWSALGLSLVLFAALWWTWIGFVVFYNRYGDDSSTWQRLVLIAATIPCGLAAVAVNDIAHGHRTAFTLSLAGVRLLLAAVHLVPEGSLPRRIAVGYTASAAALVLSVPLPTPWWWLVWIAAIGGEAVYVFAGGRFPKISRRQEQEIERDWRKALTLYRPTSPEYALNVPHLSERFGLFTLILLGEVVASAGQRAVGGGNVSWLSLAAVLAFAGVLWWIYFDASAQANEQMLALTGGSARWVRSVFAVWRMIPAYALVVTAAGLRLLLLGPPGSIAFWLVSVGLGAYLLGVHAEGGRGAGVWLRQVLFGLTFALGLLQYLLPPTAYLWAVFGWAVLCAYTGRGSERALQRDLTPQRQS